MVDLDEWQEVIKEIGAASPSWWLWKGEDK